MLSLTASVLLSLTMTPTVSPVPLGPTATPTYTIREKEIYSDGYNKGLDDLYCATLCNEFEREKQNLKEAEAGLIGANGALDSIVDLWQTMVDAHKVNITKYRKAIKKYNCDCVKKRAK